jgi:molecular chaperone GrpE
MSDDVKSELGGPELALDLDEQSANLAPDLEAAMRAAVAAVESVESGAGRPAAGVDSSAGSPAGGGKDGSDSEVARLQREVAENRDRAVRALADFDNYRKRTERERDELRKFALLDPMRDFVAVADNLDLALRAEGSADDLRRGLEMIQRQLMELFRRYSVSAIPAVGQPFDPALHEAVSREERAEVTVPTVVDELRRGYRMHERLLRPAMVRVAVPSEPGRPPAAPGAEGEEGPAL